MTNLPPEQGFLELVLKQLCGVPDALQITRTEDEYGVLLEVSADPSDTGRIIGRNGNTINALRALLKGCGNKHGYRVNLRFLAPDAN